MKFVSKVLMLNKLLCECMKAGPQEEHNEIKIMAFFQDL